jgi:hypothetical protein
MLNQKCPLESTKKREKKWLMENLGLIVLILTFAGRVCRYLHKEVDTIPRYLAGLIRRLCGQFPLLRNPRVGMVVGVLWNFMGLFLRRKTRFL